MARFDGLCLENQFVSFLALFLNLGQELVVLKSYDFLLSRQGFFSLDLKLHVIVEELFVLTIVANPFEFFIQPSPFAQMGITRLHVTKTTKGEIKDTIFSSLPGPNSICKYGIGWSLQQTLRLAIKYKIQSSLSDAFFFYESNMTESLMVGASRKDMNAFIFSSFYLSFFGFFIFG